jgi:hypothetical protein
MRRLFFALLLVSLVPITGSQAAPTPALTGQTVVRSVGTASVFASLPRQTTIKVADLASQISLSTTSSYAGIVVNDMTGQYGKSILLAQLPSSSGCSAGVTCRPITIAMHRDVNGSWEQTTVDMPAERFGPGPVSIYLFGAKGAPITSSLRLPGLTGRSVIEATRRTGGGILIRSAPAIEAGSAKALVVDEMMNFSIPAGGGIVVGGVWTPPVGINTPAANAMINFSAMHSCWYSPDDDRLGPEVPGTGSGPNNTPDSTCLSNPEHEGTTSMTYVRGLAFSNIGMRGRWSFSARGTALVPPDVRWGLFAFWIGIR